MTIAYVYDLLSYLSDIYIGPWCHASGRQFDSAKEMGKGKSYRIKKLSSRTEATCGHLSNQTRSLRRLWYNYAFSKNFYCLLHDVRLNSLDVAQHCTLSNSSVK